MAPSTLDALIQQLARLPGLGPRSARRMLLHLLKRRDTHLQPLLQQLAHAAANINTCPICGNLDDQSPCQICRNTTRNQATICVVEDVADLWALERTHQFNGLYHVLGGCLSALDGIRPQDLNIQSLLQRVREHDVREVIIATNATLDGQTTAHYLADQLQPLGVATSRLAFGVPVGGELDYLDDGTIGAALTARAKMS